MILTASSRRVLYFLFLSFLLFLIFKSFNLFFSFSASFLAFSFLFFSAILASLFLSFFFFQRYTKAIYRLTRECYFIGSHLFKITSISCYMRIIATLGRCLLLARYPLIYRWSNSAPCRCLIFFMSLKILNIFKLLKHLWIMRVFFLSSKNFFLFIAMRTQV